MDATARSTLSLALGLVLVWGGYAGSAEAQVQVTTEDYARAERVLGWHLTPLVAGDEVSPVWMRGGEHFWYRNKTGSGHEFVVVDPSAGTRTLLFDHDRLAAAMSVANDTSYVGRKLPFDDFELLDDAESRIGIRLGAKRFECDVRSYACQVGDTLPSPVPFVTSPDGRLQAFVNEHDVWVRPTEGGDSVRLTTDGEEYWSYGLAYPRPSQIISGAPVRPTLQWSPDSRRIAVQRTDERDVGKMPLYSSTHQRPVSYLYPYALPGDSILPRFDVQVLDVESRTNTRVGMPAQPTIIHGVTGMSDSTWVTVKWSEDSGSLYFTHGVRGSKRIQLMVTDGNGSAPQLLAKDTAHTFVEMRHGGRTPPNWAVANAGSDIIWFSQRDGWAHLYLYDAQGQVRNQITSGSYAVDEIKYVDGPNRLVYYTAWGAEGEFPYYRKLYRISFDGTGRELLTPEDADHEVTFTPSGAFFVDQYGTVTEPPVTVLRAARDGGTVLALETADISRVEETGWRPPEPFTVKARDGLTDIYGLMYRPSNFDPERRYPVIESIYPGPQVGSVRTWGFSVSRAHDPFAMAELGFIVVQIDHMGTPWRSKAFHDAYYGDMGDNGLPDHIAALKQLGARHAFIDLDRIGITGGSGGGFASTDALLRYPDFYKVAVSTSGNHDNRTYHFGWGEKYQGLLVRDTVAGTDNYESQANPLLADNLKGKLFLMHGDLDDNVHPAMTLQVADALIRANKSFDFLILPDRHHSLNEPYVVRRKWDYFVEHLLGLEPPENYEVTRPESR
jgi:dipeptidyl-peptidase-4